LQPACLAELNQHPFLRPVRFSRSSPPSVQYLVSAWIRRPHDSPVRSALVPLHTFRRIPRIARSPSSPPRTRFPPRLLTPSPSCPSIPCALSLIRLLTFPNPLSCAQVKVPEGVQDVYKVIRKYSGSVGGYGHDGPVYGEITMGIQRCTHDTFVCSHTHD
jgi:hypothetical protein